MWEHAIFTDATGASDAESLALPEPEVANELRTLGWRPMGRLQQDLTAPPFSALHARMRKATYAVWGASDGTTLAQCSQVYGVASVELWTLMASGAIVLTRWYDREGGIEEAWWAKDPLLEPAHARTRASTPLASQQRLIHVLNDTPSAGLHGKVVDQGPLSDAVEQHEARVRQVATTDGEPLPLDITGLAATQRRQLHVFTALLHGHYAVSAQATFVGLMIPLAVGSTILMTHVLTVALSTMPGDDPSQTMAEALGPFLGASAGFPMGFLAGRFEGVARRIGMGVFATGLLTTGLLTTGSFVFVAGGAQVLLWPALSWGLSALAVGAAVGWALRKAEVGVRSAFPGLQARGAPPPLSGEAVLRDYRCHTPSDLAGTAADGDHLATPLDGWLTQLGFEPIGARGSSDAPRAIPGDATPPAGPSVVRLWRSADHRSVAEPRAGPDGQVSLVLRSEALSGRIRETRSLPDPGPIEPSIRPDAMLLRPSASQVTRETLRWSRVWPTHAVLRVANRPAAALEVVHVEDPQAVYEEHLRWVAAEHAKPMATLEDAVVAAAAVAERRLDPPRSRARFRAALINVALIAVVVGLTLSQVMESVTLVPYFGLVVMVAGVGSWLDIDTMRDNPVPMFGIRPSWVAGGQVAIGLMMSFAHLFETLALGVVLACVAVIIARIQIELELRRAPPVAARPGPATVPADSPN